MVASGGREEAHDDVDTVTRGLQAENCMDAMPSYGGRNQLQSPFIWAVL